MNFDPDNEIVKLCAQGIETEGKGEIAKAKTMYTEAWEKASNDKERYIAAHYLARNQDKETALHWNQKAVDHALLIKDEDISHSLPSLYLNLGHSYEQLGHKKPAQQHYKNAAKYAEALDDDGYGKMTKAGIMAALERVER